MPVTRAGSPVLAGLILLFDQVIEWGDQECLMRICDQAKGFFGSGKPGDALFGYQGVQTLVGGLDRHFGQFLGGKGKTDGQNRATGL